MTTRVIALTVILDEPTREDDAQTLIEAIRLMRGVSDVQATEYTPESAIAYARARLDIRRQLYAVLNDSNGVP
jgi:hypothetical protein